MTSASPSTPDLTPLTRTLKERLSPQRWAAIEPRAHERVVVLERVAQAQAGALGRRQALMSVAPDVHWSTYLNWCRRAAARDGAPWERQLDARVPPEPRRVLEDISVAACLLRRQDPTLTCEAARAVLVKQFGDERGTVSDTVLRRLWKEAGLAQPRGGFRGGRVDEVTELYGGGALALLAAAAEETGIIDKLGTTAAEGAEAAAAAQQDVQASEVDQLRDDHGRLTGAYNRAVRGDHERDPRRDADSDKRERRDLDKLHLLRDSPTTTGRKLLAIGVCPLLTERRGFDGLEGPAGAWLEALGGPAYADTTLDRCLAELALADVGESLWAVHAQNWQEITKNWRPDGMAEPWRQAALYVDATQDPYWTHRFSASGKVSRVGRVMPCLTRVAVMGGPGVPLVIDTHAGTVSLKKELLPLLDRMDEILGDGELGRLTIVDAEMASTALLSALAQRPDKWFITVLKGGVARSAKRTAPQPWRPFRAQDRIRALDVRLEGNGAPEGGLVLRGVEMVREGSRNPVTTLFVTDATEEELPLEQIPRAYLSRWPHQEQRFRDARNGLGLERSHGYGGATVTHVALATKLEQADRRVERAESSVAKALAVEATAREALEQTERGRCAEARAVLNTTVKDKKAAERKLAKAQREQQKLDTMPREIYVRDTTRDAIATCLKMSVFMLIEFVLKEYFGGLRMEPRTFIELFVTTPVTIRERPHELVYELKANPRSRKNTERLREACDEITRRGLRLRDKPTRFVVVGVQAGP